MTHRSNPFLVEGYISKEYFCDCVEERSVYSVYNRFFMLWLKNMYDVRS